MPSTLDPALRRALADRVRYYNELGIYDFYQRAPAVQESVGNPAAVGIDSSSALSTAALSTALPSETREEKAARKSAVVVPVADDSILEAHAPKPEYAVTDPVAALKIIREDLGECTRCKLHKQGRKQIVFGVGNPCADLMFVGEGPGADEDM
jgi:uracil-DNA glycosylase